MDGIQDDPSAILDTVPLVHREQTSPEDSWSRLDPFRRMGIHGRASSARELGAYEEFYQCPDLPQRSARSTEAFQMDVPEPRHFQEMHSDACGGSADFGFVQGRNSHEGSYRGGGSPAESSGGGPCGSVYVNSHFVPGEAYPAFLVDTAQSPSESSEINTLADFDPFDPNAPDTYANSDFGIGERKSPFENDFNSDTNLVMSKSRSLDLLCDSLPNEPVKKVSLPEPLLADHFVNHPILEGHPYATYPNCCYSDGERSQVPSDAVIVTETFFDSASDKSDERLNIPRQSSNCDITKIACAIPRPRSHLSPRRSRDGSGEIFPGLRSELSVSERSSSGISLQDSPRSTSSVDSCLFLDAISNICSNASGASGPCTPSAGLSPDQNPIVLITPGVSPTNSTPREKRLDRPLSALECNPSGENKISKETKSWDPVMCGAQLHDSNRGDNCVQNHWEAGRRESECTPEKFGKKAAFLDLGHQVNHSTSAPLLTDDCSPKKKKKFFGLKNGSIPDGDGPRRGSAVVMRRKFSTVSHQTDPDVVVIEFEGSNNQFTVTPASLDIQPDGQSKSEKEKPKAAPTANSLSTNNLTALLYPPSLLEDGESDSLTQTSVTRLLGRKFRSAANYELLKVQEQQEQEKKEKEKLKRVQPKKRLVSKFESLDYDVCENKLWQKEQEKIRSLKIQRIFIARWFVMVLVGLGTAGVACFVHLSIHFLAEWKFKAVTYLLEHTIEQSSLIIPLLVWAAINMTCVLFGSLLVTIGAPAAAGSGIPHIKCFLNGVKIKGLLSLKALLAKAAGVVLSVGGGLACGKEGPMIHSGAIVAAGVSQGRCKLCNLDFKIFEFFRTDHERRDFISGGAAAGVAAAFGAPVGGLLFSLEEGASFWNQSLTWRIVLSSMIATFTVNVILSAVHGHAGDLTYPGLVSFGLFPNTDDADENITYQIIELPIFLAMAVFGGLTGALFNYVNIQLAVFRKNYLNRNFLKVLEAIVVAGMSAIVSFILLYAINDCQMADAEHGSDHGHETQMFCADGQYNTLSRLLLRSPESSLKIMLHDPPAAYSVLTLSVFMIIYYLLAVWTYGLSVSSGIFIPSLLIGATWGRLVGIGIVSAFPSMANNVGKYALIGAACQLGGIVRMTISLTVILVECTGDIRFGLPIMMVLIIAKWVADFFNQGLYDMHIQLLGIPILPWDPPEMSSNITAEKIMSMPVVAFQEVELVGNILDTLMEVTHNGFPVVQIIEHEHNEDNYGKLKGFILRSQLTLLLKKRAFYDGEEYLCKKELTTQLFRDSYPRYTKVQDLSIKEEERNFTVDLRPYMHPVPYTVRQNVSLPRVFRLFRGLGLRHLVVVDEDNEVVGIISRKDLARYRQITRRLGLGVDKLDIRDN